MLRRAPYVAALLLSGLGVREARVTVGSGREAWTLGAALAKGGSSELIARAPEPVRPARPRAHRAVKVIPGCIRLGGPLTGKEIC